ncbi:MAG TPA: hypothetical protein VGM62_12015 [Chthoniobacterales bacterium]|jgi:hypothetical protein
MPSRRSPNLRRINLLIGAILIVAGVTGGFLLTFWFLIVLLPITCVCASWMMASTVQRGQEAHIIGALLLTTLFVAWLGYFLVHGAERLTWYGIFLIWALLLIQGALHLSANRPATDVARIDDEQ